MYILTATGNSVIISTDTGFFASISGFSTIDVSVPTDPLSSPYFDIWSNGRSTAIRIQQKLISTIGGAAPGESTFAILQQLAALFIAALPSSGTGSGSFINVSAPGGPSFTSATLIGKTVYAIIVAGQAVNTGFNQPTGAGLVLFTDGTTFSASQPLTVLFG